MKTRIIPTRLVAAAVLCAVLPGLRPAQPALSSALPVKANLTPGTLDTGFDPGTGANGQVYAVALQPDGKVLIGGFFNTVNGVGRNFIARLNADGSLDVGFDPGTGADWIVYAVALQPDGKVLIGGNFTMVNGVGRNYIARLNTDGALDLGFDPGTGANYGVNSVALQPDGKVLIGGAFTQVNGVGRDHIARLNANGALDLGFDPGTGANSTVRAVALQPDGQVLIGGAFTQVNGVGRNHLARLNADGALDTGFDPGTGANDTVWAVALQPDGKVLIGGDFTQVNGVGRNHLARLNANGTMDLGFDPGTGANNYVEAVALQTDGKLLIGGYFTQVDGVGRNHLARLNANGALDTGFDPGTGANNTVWPVVLQADGKVLIGGAFTQVDGVGRNNIARLNADGSLDTGFDPGTGPNGNVLGVALQLDGKVLIGGYFTQVNGVGRNYIARLNANGALDLGFDPGTGADDWVYALVLQPDGKVLIVGNFIYVNGQPRGHIARLNANGTLDTGFDPSPGADDSVRAVALQPDGKVLIGGQFTQVNGVERSKIARLNANGTLDLGFDPGTGANGGVYALALQPDGKLLIGGAFTQVDGVGRNHIARLNADGALDAYFDPGTGANGTVNGVVLQPDGKVLIGGFFTQVNGVGRNNIARLNANGALDTGFDPGTGASNSVSVVVLQPDGKVLIGGSFTQVNGQPRNRIARLNAATSPIFTSRALLPGHVGKFYSYTFRASGLPLPSFHVTGGSLPPGLTLNAISGLFAGIPTTAGTYHFTVMASNYMAPSATTNITLVIYSEVYTPLILRQ